MNGERKPALITMQEGTVEAGPSTTIVLQPCTVATVIFETTTGK
jgi:hypothetical protein